ncbi:LytR/AlgR family response regulator transcription factor [Roseivirga echinicomitans]
MKKRILIIEDNLDLAEDLIGKLKLIGYDVIGNATNLAEAFTLVDDRKPDLIIVETSLCSGACGIDIIRQVQQTHNIPIIYLTSNCESTRVKMALETNPSAYLLKPVQFSELEINIGLAIQNFNKREALPYTKDEAIVANDAIFIPDNQMHIRIKNCDIYAVEADGSYIKILMDGKKYQLTSNLKNFVKQFVDPRFIRISRKHLINASYVEKINGNTIYLGQYEFQFSKLNRQEILSHFRILKSK